MQYKKIALDVDNSVVEDNRALFCCGTVVYRGLGYRDSLKCLLKDFQQNTVNQDDLIGHFCLLYRDGSRLTILTDQMNTLHVFVNDERTCLSSSFLALLSASPRALPLNRLAVCEKLSTGYIISPDTMVEGISQVNDELAETFSHDREKIAFASHPEKLPVKFHSGGRKPSILKQAALLKEHYLKLDKLHLEYSGDLGLSDGYDSRLLLACSKFLSKPITLHTHATTGAHDKSQLIAAKMAAVMEQPLSVTKTGSLEEQTDSQLADIIKDGLYLFDARNANSIGVCRETHTLKYKIASLGDSRLSFNGLGGEMYRNYYSTRRCGSFSLRHWMDFHDCYPFAKEVIDDDNLYEEMHLHRNNKIFKRMGLDYTSTVDFLWTRRFYSEVRVPDCDANNSDAINQVMFYHSPFFDSQLICAAMNATPYIGVGGSYQADLINVLSSSLAALPSAEGYSFDKRPPWKERVRLLLKEHYPPSCLKSRSQKYLTLQQIKSDQKQSKFVDSRQVFRESKEILLSSGVIKAFDKAHFHYAQGPSTLYVGAFMREFQDKLKW